MSRPTAAQIDALLPQTQCERCGYPGCMPYAEALAAGAATPDQCPPGGEALVRGSRACSVAPLPLDPRHAAVQPGRVAIVDPAACIGCARCLPPCPVDAILGSQRVLHTVIASWCTGCELCVPACPVDCIRMAPRGGDSPPSAADSRERHADHLARRNARDARRAAEVAALKGAAGSDATRMGPAP